MIFDPFLSACLPAGSKDCLWQNAVTNLIKIPTPPYITNPIIPSTITNPTTQSPLSFDEAPTTRMKIPTPPLLTTILSTPDDAPIVKFPTLPHINLSTTVTIIPPEELPTLTSAMKIPTPPLLTTSTSLTETSSSLGTTAELSTTKADMAPVPTKTSSVPTAPTAFETTSKIFLPTPPVIEQLNNSEGKQIRGNFS